MMWHLWWPIQDWARRKLGKQITIALMILLFDDEWTIGENEANSTLDASNEDILVEVWVDEDASGGTADGWFGGPSNC